MKEISLWNAGYPIYDIFMIASFYDRQPLHWYHSLGQLETQLRWETFLRIWKIHLRLSFRYLPSSSLLFCIFALIYWVYAPGRLLCTFWESFWNFWLHFQWMIWRSIAWNQTLHGLSSLDWFLVHWHCIISAFFRRSSIPKDLCILDSPGNEEWYSQMKVKVQRLFCL